MSDRIEAEILDVLGEEVAAAVDTPLVVIEGPKGDPGKDGITPHIGDNGNWYLGNTDTGKPSRGATGAKGDAGATGPAGPSGPVGPQGPAGPAGAPGKDGTNGADGITPSIGDNGNWYLGTTDTGKPSRGEKGDTGEKGEKGDAGSTGPQGLKGDTGPQGPKGDAFTYADFTAEQLAALKGPRGDKGDTGTQGPKGETGATGATGPKGDNGADGKSAYAYAVESGYTGTETAFAAKLAQEQLTGTTAELTPTQVYNAVSAGIPVKVQYLDENFGLLSYTNFAIAENMNMIAANCIVMFNGAYMLGELLGNKTYNRWSFITTTLAEKADIPDIPTELPNPNALTIKIGGTTVTYDGSAAKTVTIADGSEVAY